jgi:hypothetical protein
MVVNRPHSYVDTNTNPSLALCGAAQQYLASRPGNKTQVIAASLTSVEQVMQLAGIHHITLSPRLLAGLAATPAAEWAGTAEIGQVLRAAAAASSTVGGGDAVATQLGAEGRNKLEVLVKDEGRWRMAFTRADGGASEIRLVQAINIFADMQDKLEGMVKRADAAVTAGASV